MFDIFKALADVRNHLAHHQTRSDTIGDEGGSDVLVLNAIEILILKDAQLNLTIVDWH